MMKRNLGEDFLKTLVLAAAITFLTYIFAQDFLTEFVAGTHRLLNHLTGGVFECLH